MKSITSCLHQWLLKGAVVIKAEKVVFENCTFTITSGTGLSLEGGETYIYGDLHAINEADEGQSIALYMEKGTTMELDIRDG